MSLVDSMSMHIYKRAKIILPEQIYKMQENVFLNIFPFQIEWLLFQNRPCHQQENILDLDDQQSYQMET